MSSIVSPNMNLVIPGVGTEDGPQYASDINASLTILDAHDHSTGSGVPITPSGININADLSMGGNNLILARSLRLQPLVSVPALPADIGCLSVSGVDLYYTDVAGNQIRITQGGSVAGSSGTITGLPSGTASASYAGGTFVFQSATSTGANIDGASFILRNNTASSFGLTLSPPTAMGADYSLVLPSLPPAQQIMTLDAAGNIAAPYTVDNSSVEVSANVIQVKDLGITTAKLNNGSVTGPKKAALGQQISASCGSFLTTSATPVAVTNLAVTLTTTGRPVYVGLIGDGAGSDSDIIISASAAVIAVGRVYLVRGATTLSLNRLAIGGAAGNQQLSVAPSSISTIDTPAAGTYAYSVAVSTPNTIELNQIKLIAYEL